MLEPENDPNTPIADIYRRALNLFQDRNRFHQGYFQVNQNGQRCPWREGYAFCALGAMCYFGEGFSHRAVCCLQRVSEHLYDDLSIQEVNDGEGGYEKVFAALEFAIQLWDGRQPTEEELGMPVPELLRRRNG